MLVSIKIYDETGVSDLELSSYPQDDSRVFVNSKGENISISIEELKHALRKISCK